MSPKTTGFHRPSYRREVKPITVNFTMSETMRDRINDEIDASNRNASEVIRTAIAEYLDKREAERGA